VGYLGEGEIIIMDVFWEFSLCNLENMTEILENRVASIVTLIKEHRSLSTQIRGATSLQTAKFRQGNNGLVPHFDFLKITMYFAISPDKL
jgi:hypothetical protein